MKKIILIGTLLIIFGIYIFFQKNHSYRPTVIEDYSMQSMDTRADYFFQKWIISLKNEDYSTLSRVFGSTGRMAASNSRVMMMNQKNNILAYNTMDLFQLLNNPFKS